MSSSDDSSSRGPLNCGPIGDAGRRQSERVPVPESGLALGRQSRARAWVLKRIGPAGFTFGFAPVLRSPAPGPCLGLEMGDELVMAIESTRDFVAPQCDFEALGFTVEKQMRFTVEEQLETGNGERAYCATSTGQLRADTGWKYEASSEPPPSYESKDYVIVVTASKGACVGSLSFLLDAEGTEDLSSEPRPAEAIIAYRPLQGGAECPASCRGGLVGSVALVK